MVKVRGTTPMGSLEEKITRLSPEQRNELEQFIDFILQKGSNNVSEISREQVFMPKDAPPQKNQIILADEMPVKPIEPLADPLPVLSDLTMKGTRTENRGQSNAQGRVQKKDPGLMLEWID